MLIEENTVQTQTAVTAYYDGVVEAGGRRWDKPIVLRGKTVQEMMLKRPSELQVDDFFPMTLTESLPEVIIVGTGQKQEFLHPKIMAAVAAKGVGLECMSTASACRTLVLLQAEGRSVWAWLWP